ncbi:MAG: hypothetical protein ACREQN_03340 [Candidatus Binataceae bacterium]
MADLGERANVMGPQSIGGRRPTPPAMVEAAKYVLKLLVEGRQIELAALTTPTAQSEAAELAGAVTPGIYGGSEIIATARVNDHYYVKARLHGDGGETFTLQMRLGERDGRWLLWEALNLTGRRGAWTR